MKPLATLNRPVLRTVDVETKEETVSFKERTDVTAVPGHGRGGRDDGGAGAGRRGPAQVRRRLGARGGAATADAFVASLGELRWCDRAGSAPTATRHRAGRDDGLGQDDGRPALARRLGWGLRRQPTRRSRSAPAAPCRRSSAPTARPPSARWRRRRCADAARPPRAGRRGRRRRRRCSTPGNRAPAARRTTRSCGCGRRRRRWSAGSARATTGRCSTTTPAGTLERLDAERAPAVRGGGRPSSSTVDAEPADVAGRAHRRRPAPADAGDWRVITVPVDLGDRVLRGAGRRRRPPPAAPRCCPPAADAGRRSSPRPAIDVGVDPGVEHRTFLIGDGEEAKCLATVEDLCRAWARWGLTRADVVVAVGGGVVTDTAGFAAAVYHRGVAGRARAHHPARAGRRRHRRQDRREPARGQEPGRRLLAAVGRAVRHRGAGDAAAPRVPQRAGRDGQVRLPRRRRPARPAPRRGGGGLRAHARPTSWRADERETDRRAGPLLNYGHTLAHALETPAATTCATARRWPSAWSSPPAGPPARPHRRRAGRRAPRRGRRPTTCPTTCRPGVDPDELVELMGRDKKAVDGLTFVLDGPDGVEVVPGVDRPTRSSTPTLDGDAIVTPAKLRRCCCRGRTSTCWATREPEIYGTDTLDDHVGRGRGRGRAAGLDLEHLQSNHEGELVEAIHAARGRCRGHRHQPRRVHPLRLVAPRRPRRLRRPGRRAAPVQPRRPRAVAPHVGRRPGGHRRSSPASAATATSWPSRPWPGCSA